MNDLKNNFQIIVARYNENVNWLHNYKDITLIYNKGDNDPHLNEFNCINLPNFGRESHTYLYHIINNYDNLKEYTVFFQGSLDFSNEIKHNILNIQDYLKPNNFNANLKQIKFDDLKYPIKHFGKWKDEIDSGKMKKSKFTCYNWLQNILKFNNNIEYINVAWSAIFSINKSLILKKPKIFYENLLRFIDYHPNPEEGHFFERTWHFIFHNDFIKKKKINVLKFNRFDNLDNIDIRNDNYHFWMSLNQYEKYNNTLNDLVIFPNYYFQIKKYNFNFKFNDVFYIKIIFDSNNILFFILSPNLEYNFIVYNNSIINKIKNNLNLEYNNFNLIIEINILKIYINKELFYEKDIKEYNNNYIDNLPIFIKTNNYYNNIKFNKNIKTDNLKFIVIKNSYFELRHFYQDQFLNYFINYDNY